MVTSAEDSFPETFRRLVLTPAGRQLIWEEWDDVFIVYQPSSTETHVFNEMTAALIRLLSKAPMTLADVASEAAQVFGLGPEELSTDQLGFAVGRLEELGLIQWSDEISAA